MEAVLSEYESSCKKVTVQSIRNNFITALGKVDLTQPIPSSCSSGLSQNDSIFQRLQEKINELTRADMQLSVPNEPQYLNEINEIRKLKQKIHELENKENALNQTIRERNEYKQSILNIKLDTLKDPIVVKRPMNSVVLSQLELSNQANKPKFDELKAKESSYRELLEGLKALWGLKSFSVQTNASVMLELSMNYEDCEGSVSVAINECGRVHKIKIEISDHVSAVGTSVILADAQMYEPPQDLRYAVFACRASLLSPMFIRQHVEELKRLCDLQVVDASHIMLTTVKGLQAVIALHYCYPQVPGSVRVETISVLTNADPKAAASLVTLANARCFSTLPELFQFLSQCW